MEVVDEDVEESGKNEMPSFRTPYQLDGDEDHDELPNVSVK